MKIMKMIYPLAFALAITLATTGCHNHKAVKVTPIPGPASAGINDQNNQNTISSAPPFNPNDAANSHEIATAEGWDPANMNQDRAALAAYTVHFAYDSAAIKSSEQANLQSVASALSSDANAKLLIEGNCDERGTEEYNRSLGERRSLAAREALAKLGIDPSRVRTISYGKDKPTDTGHDEAAWKANRRDEFVLLHPKTGA